MQKLNLQHALTSDIYSFMRVYLFPVVANGLRRTSRSHESSPSFTIHDITSQLVAANPGLFITTDTPSLDAQLAKSDRTNRDSDIPRQTEALEENLNYYDRAWNWVKGIVGDADPPMLPYPHYTTTFLNQYVYNRSYDPSDSSSLTIAGDVIIEPNWNPLLPPSWDIWPNGSTIQYSFSDVDECVQMIFREAAVRITEATNGCLLFNEFSDTPASDTLSVVSSQSGCFASLGYKATGNIVNIGTGCKNVGTVMHLLGHVLGLAHEDQRPDARQYVVVNHGNIDTYGMSTSSSVDPMKSAKYQYIFEPLNGTRTIWEQQVMLLPYEYGSLMHNSRSVYAVDIAKDKTLTSIHGSSSYDDLFGNRGFMTERDARLLNEMYSCQRLPVKIPQRLFRKPIFPGLQYDDFQNCLSQDAADEKALDTQTLMQ